MFEPISDVLIQQLNKKKEPTNVHKGEKRSVIISGAGITGLAAARAFQQAGWQTTIIERRRQWECCGAGIALPANATKQLKTLGLLEAVSLYAQEGHAIAYYDDIGRLLCQESFQGLHPDAHPYLALSHHSLHQTMREGIDSSHIIMGQAIQHLEPLDEGVSTVLENGQIFRASILLICEGIFSPSRVRWIADVEPEDMGLFCWRFLTDNPMPKVTDPHLYLGQNSAFLIYPLKNGRCYCYGHITDSFQRARDASVNLSLLQDTFSDYSRPVKTVIENLDSQSPLICGRMSVMPEPVWNRSGFERVLCLGDAAHGCGPVLQQGVAQGLEDVAVLREELERSSSVTQGITAFVARRTERVTQVCQRSNEKLKELSHTEVQARNLVLKNHGPVHTNGWRWLFQTEV
ncbi:FAD-dependent monooxygenase [Sansalvadorimonas verongulae]|uniref:FAD-dependent monooxygenase n=1 Tax=Sansalvadorimonas verongulae TaxID=2172824 RepID=UPI0012BD2184|nr:FAD-dependent monooxygenase [Sansalvadorimonas verongulae]MTI14580.1 hypothetical protein [Sansalvadorimonas verongulae]